MTTRRPSRRGSTPRRRFVKKAVRWITITINAQLTGANLFNQVDALGAMTVAEKLEISKVVRVHFELNYSSDVGGSHTFGRFGLIIANDDAIAAGTGSLPDPIGDSDQSWMLNEHFASEQDQLVATRTIARDIRAQRLVKPGTSLAFILHVNSGASASLHWNMGMRLLIEHR